MSTISDALQIALEVLIKPFEGYHKKLPDGGCQAYPDPGTGGKPWTIGYGSTGPDIGPDTVWTLQQAEDRVRSDILFYGEQAFKYSPSLADATSKRMAAIFDFCYNCGLGNYRISTLKKKVDEQDWDEAAIEILKWNKAAGRVLAGLTRRRVAESLLLK